MPLPYSIDLFIYAYEGLAPSSFLLLLAFIGAILMSAMHALIEYFLTMKSGSTFIDRHIAANE
ncbi:hypothetical protein CUU64_06485 [Bacillus sp. V5-8f]|nr:hypothetical protein CUU64_06485 [Bacillus sp. V5-8f]